MRKILLLLIGVIVTANLLYAGGLVTNTNQSTAWTRMLSRDASIDIDAVFFNPAGLVKLKDGFHISLNSQTLWQTQTIISSFPFLNEPTYVGDVFAPVFPSVYLAWKKGRVAVSFGFNPVGGGGGATFEKGLPSMEMGFASLSKQFETMGVTGYSADMLFKGSSVYYGFQLGVSVEITKNFALFVGARYVMAKNTYQGHLTDITFLTADGTNPRADDFMIGVADNAAAQAQFAGEAMQPLMDAGLGDFTIEEAVTAGAISPENAAIMIGGLMQFGLTQDEINAMNLSQSQTYFYGASAAYLSPSNPLRVGAGLMADQEGIDVVQTGNGVTPIVGANFTFNKDRINIGVKYEFKTKLDLTNETKKDFIIGVDPTTGEPITMFPNGEKTNADIPAMLSIGIGWHFVEPITFQLGYHTYFDKASGWAKDENGLELIDKNFSEYSFGVEWSLSPSFRFSGGYLYAVTGVNENYQSDLSFSLTTNTFGGGLAWDINEAFTLQFGGFATSYADQTYDKTYSGINYTETYKKFTYAFSIGLDINIGKK